MRADPIPEYVSSLMRFVEVKESQNLGFFYYINTTPQPNAGVFLLLGVSLAYWPWSLQTRIPLLVSLQRFRKLCWLLYVETTLSWFFLARLSRHRRGFGANRNRWGHGVSPGIASEFRGGDRLIAYLFFVKPYHAVMVSAF